MRIIGITGPTGAGKSTVRRALAELGYHTIDADELYHSLLIPPSPCIDALRMEFGETILRPDGSLDRAALAELVFSDESALQRLNAAALPIVIAKTRELIRELEACGVAALIIDAPTLIESGFDKECDFVLSISAPREVRIERIRKRDGIDRQSAERRVCGQMPDEFYKNASDAFIYDEGDAELLIARARDALGI